MAPATIDARDEMTAIDGVNRADAEVVADHVSDEPYAEDWTQQEGTADDLETLIVSMVEKRLAREREQIQEAAIAKAMAVFSQMAANADSKPPLSMTAKPHDRFITESNAGAASGQPWLRHFRCETAVSTKMTEIDLDLYDKYMSGDLERPTDDKGRPYSDGRILALCEIPGQYIVWVEGHCYCYTENQVRNVERVDRLAVEGKQGGMQGIYEDHGGASWQCQVCPSRPSFLDERTWRGHMIAVHAVSPQHLG